MDFETAKQVSRKGFADVHQTIGRMLADLDDAERAEVDWDAAGIAATLKANSIPVDAITMRAFCIAVALPSVELYHHHPELQHIGCIDGHFVRIQLAAYQLLFQQEGGT